MLCCSRWHVVLVSVLSIKLETGTLLSIFIAFNNSPGRPIYFTVTNPFQRISIDFINHYFFIIIPLIFINLFLAFNLIARDLLKRRTAFTLSNARSSRSHTICTISVYTKENLDDGIVRTTVGGMGTMNSIKALRLTLVSMMPMRNLFQKIPQACMHMCCLAALKSILWFKTKII